MAKRTIPPEPCSAQEKSSYSRQLKVRKGYYSYQYDSRNDYSPSKPVPWVHIKGYWLNQVGFTIDTALSVQVENGCITIRPQASPS